MATWQFEYIDNLNIEVHISSFINDKMGLPFD
jgi:hypothetical protein